MIGPPTVKPYSVFGINRFFRFFARGCIQFLKVVHRIKGLGQKPPAQGAMEFVGAGLGDQVKHSPSRSAELHAEIAGLCGGFLDRIQNVEHLSLPTQS